MSKIAQFKENFDLVEYCAKNLEGAVWKGKKLFVSCPFHLDDTPSMMVYPDYAYCFGCGRKADAIDIIEAIEKLSVDDILNHYTYVNVPHKREARPPKPIKFNVSSKYIEAAHRILLVDKRAQNYLIGRGITLETIKRRKIGYIRPRIKGARYPRFMIPGYDTSGKLINISFRRDDWYPRDHEYPESQKYLLHPGSHSFFYGAEHIDCGDTFLYVGGQIDSLCLEPYGILSFGAIGEASYRQEWGLHFADKKIIIILDNDEAGRKASERMHQMIENSCVARWPAGTEGMDINDLILSKNYGVKALERMVEDCGISIQKVSIKTYR